MGISAEVALAVANAYTDEAVKGGGGGGGGSHLYKVITSNNKMSELYIFTSKEVTIGTAAQLVTALDGNLGIITNGKLNGSDVNKLPRFAYIKSGVNNKVYLKCAVFTVADNAVTVAMSDSDYVETAYLSSVTSTKIY